MPKTYAQIQKQIETLQQQAEAIKHREVADVIERIRVAIDHYGITPDQVFGSQRGNASIKSKSTQSSAAAKFADANGNAWSGRGPHPQWLRNAIAGGATLDDFRTGAVPTKRAKAHMPKRKKRAASKLIYADGAGNTWSGRGPRPGWLKAALESGRDLKDMTSAA